MISRESKQSYDSQPHMVSTINNTRPAYDALVAKLSMLGTEVARDRELETDTIAPYDFVRKGTVEFVFPPQPDVGPLSYEGQPVSGTLGQIVIEKATRNFDESLVTGRLIVNYDDASNRAAMSVADVLGESSVSDEVVSALDDAFAAFKPVESPH